ncbi:CDK5 and ABL1 enzyme substrate 2 isoform X2 [Rhizophagus clarus]|uniref:CDK5 and ABL1 enzyme substrate 2 isoform X2 n=1 Tax=Rhizophagus clarus TaxID=94130 RepID=A0A8H3LTH3_9GLOM|nr:CDK5 and ABL1 enzyme substrate 2 isoform X2 [Rhizophagus clarus]
MEKRKKNKKQNSSKKTVRLDRHREIKYQIPRRRDSSRQAAFTFLSNISLGTESYPPSNPRATAVPSHSVTSPSQPSDVSLKQANIEKQQQTINNDHEVLGNDKPSLQSNTKRTALSKPPKKTGGNHILSKSSKTTDNDKILDETSIETYGKEHDLNKIRGRSNSLREEATNFLTNINLDPKKSKPYHLSKEGKVLEIDDGSIIEVDMNQVDDIVNDLEYNNYYRRSSESTYKSDSSSSSANSIPEKSASRKPQCRHPSPNPNHNILNNPNDLNHKQNNANFSSSMGFLSILGYDKKFKQKNRRDFMKQTADSETTKQRKAESFAHLLVPSNSLGSKNDGDYNPTYLDNPNLNTEKQPVNEVQETKPTKHRNVLSLSNIMGSLIHHNNRPSDLKRESNARFRMSHPEVDQTLTLSQIRKVKLKLLTVATYEDLDLELSTVAKAYAYFEKLILKKVVNKANRRLYGSICLLLASKVNEPMGKSYLPILESLHKHLDVTIKDITDNEFSVFAHLDFELYLPMHEFMPHFERLFQTIDNKEEYLGNNPFYEFNLIG